MTGLGAVSALGHDAASLWQGVSVGSCGIGPIRNMPTERLGVPIAAEVAGWAPQAHFAPRLLSMMDRMSQFALLAARQAMQQASFQPLPPEASVRAGAITGAAIGQDTFDTASRALYQENVNRMHPLTVPRIMPSAPASLISMEFGLRGACFAVASACASSTHAIGLAFHMVRSGMLDLAVAGGTDASLSLGYLKAWEALRVLSPDACRPFSRDRTGLVLGEGAAMLVLEDWDHAERRGAAILGEVAGFGMTADAADMTAPDAMGAARAMQAALDDAGAPPEAVGYVNAHGTGTRLNDRTETAALRRVFGAHADRLAVSSSKSMFGHCLCAAGALEAVVTVEALRHRLLPPTIGFREVDPECDLDCVPNAARPAAPDLALSNSFAFGGLNAVLAFRTVPPARGRA